MTGVFEFIFLIILGLSPSADAKLIQIPAGQVRAIWLASVKNDSTKNNEGLPRFPVKSFYMMDKAVTQFEYTQFLKKHPKWQANNVNKLFADKGYLDGIDFDVKFKSTPMTSISWFAARAYCDSLGMRLPSVNEWEYVAAASETQKDANKDPEFLKRILEWYGEPRTNGLKNVGEIYKNIYDVWDMHGLIWEWVDDFNSSFVTGESREDSSLNKDMFCGAGALSFGDKENYAAFMRFAFRSSLNGKSSIWNLGFRCVRDL